MHSATRKVLDLLIELIHLLRLLAHHHAVNVDILLRVASAGAVILSAHSYLLANR